MRGLRLTRAAGTFWGVLSLPAVLLHELAHAVASFPWARRIGIVVEPRTGYAECHVEFRDSAGRWPEIVAGVAPMALGWAAAIVALALWLLDGGEIPSSTMALVKVAVLTTYWVIFMTPSAVDGDLVWDGDDDG